MWIPSDPLWIRFPGQSAAAVAKIAFGDGHLDKLFTAAVQISQEVQNNVLSSAQWLVNSVTTDNLLPIFGNLRYDELYERIRAIRSRFRTFDIHGLICVTKLLLKSSRIRHLLGTIGIFEKSLLNNCRAQWPHFPWTSMTNWTSFWLSWLIEILHFSHFL